MRNKRGWIRILEATIGVLMISSVLVVVYSWQIDRGVGPEDYVYSLQNQILADVSSRSDLRSDVLRGETESLDEYVREKIPAGFDFALKVCNLTNPPTPCKLDAVEFIALKDKDVYVEEAVISADFQAYSPKKIKLFVWEKELVGDCVGNCPMGGTFLRCSGDDVEVKTCEDLDGDGCFDGDWVFNKSCDDACEEGKCVDSCEDECELETSKLNCSEDGDVVRWYCSDCDEDTCSDYCHPTVEDDCNAGEDECVPGKSECQPIVSDWTILTCERRGADSEDRCTHNSNIDGLCNRGGSLSNDECECEGWGPFEECGLEYVCFQYETWGPTKCLLEPNDCSDDSWSVKSKETCGLPCNESNRCLSPGDYLICSDDCVEMRTCSHKFGAAEDCYEWAEGEPVLVDCCDPDDGLVCEEGIGCVSGWARLEASYNNLHYDSGSGRWYYNLVITESNGVGVTLSHRIRCWLNGDCESSVYDPVAKFGTDKINPNGQVTSNDRWFWTDEHPDQMNETWYGIDDKGNSVKVRFSIDTP